MTETATLAAALAELQSKLPRIGKDKKAKVRTKTGADYTYDYANLATVSREILPLLGESGLSFTARPTLREDGKFVLAYSLLHVSGEREDGVYPLPSGGTPQEIGSAITYARRYCLCAVTGAAPDDDDDDAQAAETGARAPARRGRRAAAPSGPPRPLEELPRNQDGSISRSQLTEEELDKYGFLTGAKRDEHNALRAGAEGELAPEDEGRLRRCSPGNPCHEEDCPSCTDLWNGSVRPPLRKPQPALKMTDAIRIHFERLGYTDRDVRLGITAKLAGRTERLSTSKDLTASEGIRVRAALASCKDAAALDRMLEEVSVDA